MMRQRKIPEKKLKEINLLKKYISEYNVVGLVSMEKITSKAITNIRRALRGQVVMRMSKKRLMLRALEESEATKHNILLLGEKIKGNAAFVFTNMNPVKLNKFLESNATKGAAKAGDIAPEDIKVKAGNTRIPPGPIISELNQYLKLPTMIKDGMIHIKDDTTTHKKGAVIDLKSALLLGRLGIEPMTIMLNFYTAWENGELIAEEVLKLDEKKIIKDVQTAQASAVALAVSLGILSKETLPILMAKAFRQANALAFELPMIIPDMVPQYFQRAAMSAAVIENIVFGESAVAEVKKDKKTEKKKEDERKDDNEVLGEGIGSLFG
jgi:large subunit ribosomal protein L10